MRPAGTVAAENRLNHLNCYDLIHRRLTMPATESRNGRFQFNPGSATRRNLPNRVITATSAVRTVKKLARIT